MQRRLREMEEEAEKLKDEHEKVDDAMASENAGANAEEDAVKKQEADARSVFVGQVDYASTPEDLAKLFASCGTVNRVTILHDKFDNPKGFAYVEFLEPDAVHNAILLDGSELRGRKIKVSAKRTNVPGMKAGGRGGRGGRGRGRFGGRGAPMMMMMMPYSPYGRGGRGRGRGRGGRGGRGRGRGEGESAPAETAE
jgi:polyadenylate-binding protein 2